MGKLIEAVKQFKEVVELREENKVLYGEKTCALIDLEEERKKYELTQKACRKYYKTLNEIKDIVNENQNGSVLNLQNKIKSKLNEVKI